MVAAKRTVAFDTETYRLQERGKASLSSTEPVVCGQFYERGKPSLVLPRRETARTIIALLEDDEVRLVGHNVAFDFLQACRLCSEELGEDILPLVFEKYDKGLVADTIARCKLKDISEGGCWSDYQLDSCVRRELGVKVTDKHGPDVWRLRYNELAYIPIECWPESAYNYARMDPVHTLDLYEGVKPHSNEGFQCASAWWLMLMTGRGLRVDPAHTARMYEHFRAQFEKFATPLEELGYIDPVKKTMIRAKKQELIAHCFDLIGEKPWLTKKGKQVVSPYATEVPTKYVAADKKTVEYLLEKEVDEPIFKLFSGYHRAEKMLSTYVQPVMDAYEGPLHHRVVPLINTGRVATRGPNVQSFPSRENAAERARKKLDPEAISAVDLRGCFIPREGFKYVAADYAAVEMAGLAQYMFTLFGEITPLGRAINEGMDLHSYVAAVALGITYEEAIRRKEAGDKEFLIWRQLCKIANFSFPTGALAASFQMQVRAAGHSITIEQAEFVRETWFKAWEGISRYRAWVDGLRDHRGMFPVQQQGPGGKQRGWRMRLCQRATQAANSPFQGICADGAKYAGWLISRACYLQPDSPLYESRIVLFVHDEFVLETPEEKAEGVLYELPKLMDEGMSAFIPDIRTPAEGQILTGGWAK